MERIRNSYYWALAAASVYLGSAFDAVAQTTDPSAPLEILRTARQKASSSNLKADSISSGMSSLGYIFMAVAAVGGIALAGSSGFKLYRATQDENARESAGRSVGGIIIGSAITILGVVIGVVTNYMTGSS